ncbi:hypothetical protein DFH27DRAFT_550475 [Peziza echinospora]|nr:hypothetical protein DFH27DRAFT_550475 [Peziza echinospora]
MIHTMPWPGARGSRIASQLQVVQVMFLIFWGNSYMVCAEKLIELLAGLFCLVEHECPGALSWTNMTLHCIEGEVGLPGLGRCGSSHHFSISVYTSRF